MKDDPRLIDKRLNYNSHNAIKKDILQVGRYLDMMVNRRLKSKKPSGKKNEKKFFFKYFKHINHCTIFSTFSSLLIYCLLNHVYNHVYKQAKYDTSSMIFIVDFFKMNLKIDRVELRKLKVEFRISEFCSSHYLLHSRYCKITY